MVYYDFNGKKISSLGFGTMRLPTNEGVIDEAESRKMVAYAMENGVNYFDTAYGYHGGESEKVIGKLLSEYPRDSFYLADKFPGYDLNNMGKVEEIFEEQLKKCGVEYFDFYLFHNVYERNLEGYLDEKNGILKYLLKQKENGRIKHLGLSVHGSEEILEKFLDAYGEHMEFCQVQLNYIDWSFQEARKKVEMLNKRNIPIWVMEPLRGGMLTRFGAEREAVLKGIRPEESMASMAFRYLQGVEGVGVILSGMSDFAQMKDNIKTFSEYKPLDKEETAKILKLADDILNAGILPCTSCRYCTPHCPMELDIPRLLSLYNEHTFTGGGFLAPMAIEGFPKEKRPSACIGCKSCEAVCPQQLEIADALKKFSGMLGM